MCCNNVIDGKAKETVTVTVTVTAAAAARAITIHGSLETKRNEALIAFVYPSTLQCNYVTYHSLLLSYNKLKYNII